MDERLLPPHLTHQYFQTDKHIAGKPLHFWKVLSVRIGAAMIIAALAIGGIFMQISQNSTAQAGCQIYVVHAGDTLAKIAGAYHTTIATIAQANGIRNINLIVVGQQLCVAGSSAPTYQSYGYIPAGGSCQQSVVVQRGDTVAKIAALYHTSITMLAQGNHLSNPNWIFVGQSLCISWSSGGGGYYTSHLEWSNQNQVRDMLIQAADRHGLPRNLVLAIGWAESNWTQHVISWDGGVGTMQLMSYTTAWLNTDMGTHYDPYQLYDNIELGTSYLRMLWNTFPNDLNKIISAYNEGSHNVITRGIFNWFYVERVLAFMRRFS